jgi:hypothetical protein
MPPVAKSERDTLRKDVDFVSKDDTLQQATGIVMVPYAVDLHGDWERPETIQQFAEQFGNFEEVGEGGGGVMHAVWPDEHISLERNDVVSESTTINGADVPEGAWVQTWQFDDPDLWGLVEDGILSGYSIGAINVDWEGPTPQEELPDEVSVPDEMPEDEPAWELTDGLIREVSAVDIPAVPDAQILETKAEAEKRLADHLGNRDGFIEEAMERGHSEAEAERLWEYLNRAVDVEGAGDPAKESFFKRIGEAAFDAIRGSTPDDSSGAASAETKAGRTLSKRNRESAMAAIDANLDMLEDSGMDHGLTRFTDRDDVDFDLSEHDAREWTNPPDDDEGEDEDDDGDEEEDGADMDDVSASKDAPDGDTSDETTDMSNSDDPWEDAPEWAKDLRDSQQENSQRIEDLASEDGDADKDADTDDEDALDDAPEWAKALAKGQQENAERIDTIAQQSGVSGSGQIDAAANGSDEDEESGLDAVGKMLS